MLLTVPAVNIIRHAGIFRVSVQDGDTIALEFSNAHRNLGKPFYFYSSPDKSGKTVSNLNNFEKSGIVLALRTNFVFNLCIPVYLSF